MKSCNDYRLPSLDALLAFQTAAQLKSFERAAEALSLTASALRKRIASLEQLLGLVLFDRQGGTLALTAQGKMYLEQLTPVLTQLIAIPVHQRPAQRRQRLTLSCPPTFARQILIPRLAEHSQHYPDIDLEIQLSAPMSGTEAPLRDIQVSGDSATVEPQHRLLDELLQPLAAPELLSRYPDIQLPQEFACLPLMRSPLEPWQPWFQQAHLALSEPGQGPSLLDLGMMLEAAANAQGVVLARPSLARDWLESGRLVAVGNVRSVPSYHYQLHMHQRSEAAQAFSHWLTQICHEAVEHGQRYLSDPH